METRIYEVRNLTNDQCALIEAGSASQAIGYLVRNTYSAKVATAKQVASAMGAGVTVTKAQPATKNAYTPLTGVQNY